MDIHEREAVKMNNRAPAFCRGTDMHLRRGGIGNLVFDNVLAPGLPTA